MSTTDTRFLRLIRNGKIRNVNILRIMIHLRLCIAGSQKSLSKAIQFLIVPVPEDILQTG